MNLVSSLGYEEESEITVRVLLWFSTGINESRICINVLSNLSYNATFQKPTVKDERVNSE